MSFVGQQDVGQRKDVARPTWLYKKSWYVRFLRVLK